MTAVGSAAAAAIREGLCSVCALSARLSARSVMSTWRARNGWSLSSASACSVLRIKTRSFTSDTQRPTLDGSGRNVCPYVRMRLKSESTNSAAGISGGMDDATAEAAADLAEDGSGGR